MRRLLPLLLLAFTIPALTQTKHPFTFEDMMKLKRVGEPQVSPDGKWVIFSVVDVDLAANTKTPHVWIVPLGTQAPSTAAKDSQANPSSSLGMTGSKSGMTREREIIADQDADRPRWAPDGKYFAFLSAKGGESPQVWVAGFDGASGTVYGVTRLTEIAGGAGGELWSPDGREILFTADVYPECDGEPSAEDACNAQRFADAARSKIKAQIFDHLLYRHWNAYKEGKRSHIFVVPVLHLPIPHMLDDLQPRWPPPRDLTPGDYDAPVFSLGGQDDYAFSPDGKEICYTSNHDKNPAASTNNDLWIVPVDFPNDAKPADVLAKTKNITADNPASDSTPLYSPDGRYIAYRAQQRPGYESDRFRLMLYDRKTDEKKDLTEDFDRWVGSITWTPDSKQLYFTAENEGGSLILRITAGGGRLTQVEPCRCWGSGGVYDDLQFSPDGRVLLATENTLQSPVEIVALGSLYEDRPWVCVCDSTPVVTTPCPTELEFLSKHGIHSLAATASQVRLTHINDATLNQVALSQPEAFWFHGATGDPVEGLLVRPPGFAYGDKNKKYPVKFLIHGGPQGAWGDDWTYRWNAELFASPTSATPSGYVVIMINFHGSTGYGQKFIDSINGDWGGAPFEDLMKGLDYAEEHYPFIDKDRECALGASFGGYMINWVLGHTDRFKCLVSHDGDFNNEASWGTTEEMWFPDWEFHGTPYDNREMYRKWSPHLFAKNFKTPTLVIHGQKDYRVDVSEGLQLFTTLQMEGVPSKMLYFPDEGHWVLKPQNSQLWWKTVNDWVDQWVGK